ncbi:MAG: DUF2164 domain-containing protein [Thermoanaerobaculia bacterium]
MSVAIQIEAETRKRMVASIRRYFEQELDEEIGDLQAGFLLDFFLGEIAPTVYNRAIADAQGWMLGRVEDLEGSLYEPEFDYWER